ncbi:unnamed protein product [Lactuca saligna]|uniref:Nuclear pore complex protein NUP1 n=1 Tax=Lactuca saligna TaxID=75948 RepID=A0AA35Y124_LACSI|nr:unnamed protein product [Lactuca saligna]
MESAKPSSSAPPYSRGGAGAGGKFRKPPISRKRPSTPYDRPSLTTGNNKSDEPQDGGGSWLSKLVVNPARRLIVGGATRILPSFFSKSSDSSSADEYEDDPPGDRDDQDIDATANAKSDAKHTLEIGVSSNEVDKLKGSSEHNILQQDESKNSPSNHGLAKIENMLKGKHFSRDERNRLMEILNSRLADVSNAEEEKKTPEVISLSHGKAKENMVETPMPHLQSNVKDEVVASPIDIARAYMGNRTSEKLGFNTYTIKSKDERESQNHDLIHSKPHNITPSSKSPTCWPGVMVQEQRGYLTPQIQRTRYGLHGFPRTPYSRTIYSSTKPKLQGDNKPSNVSPTPFQHSRTPIFGQMKSSGDVYGSVGPIRRVRNKFPFEPQSERRNASRSFVPVIQKNPEASGSGVTSGASSETVRKIMEQLDRHKPTPKEKADELKLATEWKRSSSENNSNLIIPNSKESSILGSFVKRNDDGVDPIKTLNKDTEPSFGFKNTNAAAADDEKEKEKSQPWSYESQINGQDASKKRQSQPMLKPISFKRPDPQQVISSSDNSRGFTFPFSGTASSASEPPTPSIMPSFSAVIPSYSFGKKKSERVVFSFPSTSSGVIPIGDGESDLKFNFGSDKKRVSFGSIGTDAIAIN